MILLIPLAICLSTAGCYLGLYQHAGQPLRRSLLTALTGIFFFIAASTELLSSIHGIQATSIRIIWALLDLLLFFFLWKQKEKKSAGIAAILQAWLASAKSFVREIGWLPAGMLLIMGLITLTVAFVATPNNADSLSYHLSRLGYWIQDGHVGHYASHIERAISFSPFSEYVHLHTFLLAGSERYFQCVQWFCLAGILVVVSLVVGLFKGSGTSLATALVFAATLPIVVLESMTTQNDLVAAFFVSCTAMHVFDYVKKKSSPSLPLLAMTVALGLMTKGTFVFFAFPFGLYLLLKMVQSGRQWKKLAVLTAGVIALTLLLNAPFWYRTYRVFGSPIGTMSAGNRNELGGVTHLLSSTSKHVFLHLGFVSPGNKYNAFLEDRLKSLHQKLGTPLNNPRAGMEFKMNKLNFNEDFAHNLLGMVLILLTVPLLFSIRSTSGLKWYALLVFGGFLTFCYFITYQVYGSRLHIPFFLLAAPIIGLVYGNFFSRIANHLLMLILWLAALPFALLSVTHPLLSTRWFFDEIFPPVNKALHLNIRTENQLNLKQGSILFSTPEKMLWGDQWPEIERLKTYVDSLDVAHIGFDFEEYSYDYGYQYILRKPGRQFAHVKVRNASAMLELKDFKPDCIIAEHDEGDRFFYHGKWYRKTWSGTFRWVYTPDGKSN
ncbi:glycosyltransferase family 39 protein [Dyadobacter sandarakinus]|uniref:Glycosyltransferase family 39 protein n=1 Tax=Dyadobacter sandarakinus TaxID=2747268 RepID=A0ABX7ICL5_9BACT|nr:glycosyltransferase family 39 protein [Dyadobacter sandarakinus]QRR03277.1 glycosyltransferase family 39 protein [Dyadobacter sandarakinus]